MNDESNSDRLPSFLASIRDASSSSVLLFWRVWWKSFVACAALLTVHDTGESKWIDSKMKDVNEAGAFVRDQEAMVPLRVYVLVEAAHTLRSIGDLQRANSCFAMAVRLLSDHLFLRLPFNFALVAPYEYESTADKDRSVLNHLKLLVDNGAVGGAGGMYGMCSIHQGEAATREALEKLFGSRSSIELLTLQLKSA